ncbi:hypothetical protein [Gibbsiella quercinecans]|uniref:hypothetical protein n=1 Tax=Gibbsiella quercinecans TaxID=929813 RepID=UPI003A4D9E9D
MDENISQFQKIKVLLAFIRGADEKGNVDFDDPKMAEYLGGIFSNGNHMDSLLYSLNESGILYYDEIVDDGFKPIIMAGVSKKNA